MSNILVEYSKFFNNQLPCVYYMAYEVNRSDKITSILGGKVIIQNVYFLNGYRSVKCDTFTDNTNQYYLVEKNEHETLAQFNKGFVFRKPKHTTTSVDEAIQWLLDVRLNKEIHTIGKGSVMYELADALIEHRPMVIQRDGLALCYKNKTILAEKLYDDVYQIKGFKGISLHNLNTNMHNMGSEDWYVTYRESTIRKNLPFIKGKTMKWLERE